MAKRKDPVLRTLGWRIRQLREAQRLTQEGLAERADLDRSYIAGIEAGLRNPTVKVLSKISTGLGTTLATLFEPDAAS